MNKVIKNNWLILFIIYLIATFFRMLLIYIFSWDWGLHYEYAEIARYLVDGKGYWYDWYSRISPQPTAMFTPLYTYFLALFLLIFDDPARPIFIAQSLISALIIYPAYLIGKFYGGVRNGVILSLLVALYPEIAFISGRMVAEVITIVLLFLVAYLYLKFKSELVAHGRVTGFIILGFILGISTLTKANMAMLFITFFVGVLFIKVKRKNWFKAAFLLGIAFTITLSPWFVRNYIVFDKLVFRSMYGFNLWRGNHPGASGTARLEPYRGSESDLSAEYLDYIEQNSPDTELGRDEFYKQEAYKFICQDPGRYIRLTLRRTLYFLTIDPTHPLTRNPVYIGGYIFLLVFGIWGGIILKRRKQFDRYFILAPLINMIFYVPIFILPRYRLILIGILIILTSISLTHLINKTNRFDGFLPSDVDC